MFEKCYSSNHGGIYLLYLYDQTDSKLRVARLSTSFTAKSESVFVFPKENAFLERFFFKVNRKAICHSIKRY